MATTFVFKSMQHGNSKWKFMLHLGYVFRIFNSSSDQQLHSCEMRFAHRLKSVLASFLPNFFFSDQVYLDHVALMNSLCWQQRVEE